MDVKKKEIYTVAFCHGAQESLNEALRHVNPGQHKTMLNRLSVAYARMASGGKLSADKFPSEGELPNGSKFYCIKRIPIRAYYWRSTLYPKTLFISHFIYKDFQKLRDADTNKVNANWRRIEEDGHDS